MVMKKVLFAASALLALALAGLGSAQKFSVYTGYPLGLGGMYYFNESLRADLTLMVVPGSFGVGGGVDYIIGRVPIIKQDPFPVNFYYGAGASLGYVNILGTNVMAAGANVFGGVEYRFNQGFGIFSEFGAGPVFGFYSGGSVFTLDFLGRFGVNFY